MSSSRNALRSRPLRDASTSFSSVVPQMTVPAYRYSSGRSTAVSADRSTSRNSEVAAYFAAADVAAPLAAAAAHMLGSRILEKSRSVASASLPAVMHEVTCVTLSAATATVPAICVTFPQAPLTERDAHSADRNTIASSSAALRAADATAPPPSCST